MAARVKSARSGSGAARPRTWHTDGTADGARDRQRHLAFYATIMYRRLVVVLALTLVPSAPAHGAEPYRNPSAGAQIALQVAGMDRAGVRRDIVYAKRDGRPLRLDVY